MNIYGHIGASLQHKRSITVRHATAVFSTHKVFFFWADPKQSFAVGVCLRAHCTESFFPFEGLICAKTKRHTQHGKTRGGGGDGRPRALEI